jgi:hypothetical protein
VRLRVASYHVKIKRSNQVFFISSFFDKSPLNSKQATSLFSSEISRYYVLKKSRISIFKGVLTPLSSHEVKV